MTTKPEPTQLAVIPIEPDGEITMLDPNEVAARVAEWNAYQDLTKQLLSEEDYQFDRSGRGYKKKSAWRKYAKAFRITDEIVEERIERDARGVPRWAFYRVRATHAPSGRWAEGVHGCNIAEKCCPTAYGEPCERARYDAHECCFETCSGRRHWSHPDDIPATAHTRAKNRAISDLIGAGEVSAEEAEESSGGRRPPARGAAREGEGRARSSSDRGAQRAQRSQRAGPPRDEGPRQHGVTEPAKVMDIPTLLQWSMFNFGWGATDTCIALGAENVPGIKAVVEGLGGFAQAQAELLSAAGGGGGGGEEEGEESS